MITLVVELCLRETGIFYLLWCYRGICYRGGINLDYSYKESLYLLYARLNDLEQRQRIAKIESDKILGIVILIDKVLETKIGLTESEVSYHKLSKYKMSGGS